MLRLLVLNMLFLWINLRFVIIFSILYFRNLIISGNIFKMFRAFRNHLLGPLSKAFLLSIQAIRRFFCLDQQFSMIILFIRSWSLQPYDFFFQVYCSPGKRYFITIIIIVIKSRWQYRIHWFSLTIYPYHSTLLAGLLECILCSYRADISLYCSVNTETSMFCSL